MRWTGNQAKAWVLLSVLLVVSGCSYREQPPEATQRTLGIVQGVLGLELSDSPGSPPNRAIRGNLAIVVESRPDKKVAWSRLVTSDGVHGWTSSGLVPSSAVEVEPLTHPFTLMNKSPDAQDFSENAEEIPIANGTKGSILGASSKSRVSSTRSLMVPERLRRDQLPWLFLEFGSDEGYAPIDGVTLTWPAGSGNGTLEDTMEAAGMRGLVWRPFLGPVKSRLMELAPRPGADGYFMDGTAVAARQAKLPESWDGVEVIYREANALLIVFSSGTARLFRFISSGAATSDIFAPNDEPYPGRVMRMDLNADGNPEWILEIVGVYGDGYYSALWVIDGMSGLDGLKSARLPLSHSSGEKAGDAEATWEIAPDGMIRVTRTKGEGRASSQYRYTDRLAELPN